MSKTSLRTSLSVAPALAALAVGGILFAAPASAAPQCVDTAPRTTMCTTNGSAQLTTSPPAQSFGPFYGGFPFGGFGSGIGW